MYFNPHQREEGDFRFQSQYTLHLNVSIHTNARRMPLIIRGLKEDVNISLPQLEGGDLTIQPASNLIHHFNPHHREGGDIMK